MALAASVLAFLTVAGLSAAYFLEERQARRARAAMALSEVRLLLEQAQAQADDSTRWRTALAGLQGAEKVVDARADAASRTQISEFRGAIASGAAAADRDRVLLGKLSDTRAGKHDLGPGAAEEAYAKAFREAGLDVETAPVELLATAIKKRPPPVQAELARHLDDWAGMRRQIRGADERSRKILQTADAIDSDPYRARVRRTLDSKDLSGELKALQALAADPHAQELPPSSSTLLASVLYSAGDVPGAVALSRKATERHPSDPWVNFDLASYLAASNPAEPDEAIRYFTVARALRPTSAHQLAHTLLNRGRDREGIAVFRDLERLQGDVGTHAGCEGLALKELGHETEGRAALDAPLPLARVQSPASLTTQSRITTSAWRCTGLARSIRPLPQYVAPSSSSPTSHRPIPASVSTFMMPERTKTPRPPTERPCGSIPA